MSKNVGNSRIYSGERHLSEVENKMNKKYRNITISVQNKKRFSKILGQLQMVAGKPVFANEGFEKMLDLYEQVDAEILKVVPQ